MNTTQDGSRHQIGEIPLEDYLEAIGHDKKRKSRRLSRYAGVLVMCMLCMAAGDYLGPWSGKGALDLSFEEALAVVEGPAPPNHSRSAAERLRRYCKRSIQALSDLKDRGNGLDGTADAILAGIAKLAQQAR